METDVISWVATGYGWPRWMVALLFDLSILESRAARRVVAP